MDFEVVIWFFYSVMKVKEMAGRRNATYNISTPRAETKVCSQRTAGGSVSQERDSRVGSQSVF